MKTIVVKIPIFVLGLILSSAMPAMGQDSPFVLNLGGRPVIRPDSTYFFNHVPRSDLVFEGQIAPRIIILDSIADAAGRVLDGGAHWGWQVSTTPMVKLRMFDETSSPVRTPSYMPKGNIQFVRMRNLSRADKDDEAGRYKGPVEMWLIDTIPFGHHSNGQNGCLFTEQSRNSEGECVAAAGTIPRTVNKIDGSFSTNYVEAALFYGRMYLAPGADAQEYATAWEWRGGGGVQLNPSGFLGGGIDDELKDLYGQTRFFVESMAARRDLWRCGRAEGQLQLHYIHDAPAGLPAVKVMAEGSCLPAALGWDGTLPAVLSRAGLLQPGFCRVDHPVAIRLHPSASDISEFPHPQPLKRFSYEIHQACGSAFTRETFVFL